MNSKTNPRTKEPEGESPGDLEESQVGSEELATLLGTDTSWAEAEPSWDIPDEAYEDHGVVFESDGVTQEPIWEDASELWANHEWQPMEEQGYVPQDVGFEARFSTPRSMTPGELARWGARPADLPPHVPWPVPPLRDNDTKAWKDRNKPAMSHRKSLLYNTNHPDRQPWLKNTPVLEAYPRLDHLPNTTVALLIGPSARDRAMATRIAAGLTEAGACVVINQADTHWEITARHAMRAGITCVVCNAPIRHRQEQADETLDQVGEAGILLSPLPGDLMSERARELQILASRTVISIGELPAEHELKGRPHWHAQHPSETPLSGVRLLTGRQDYSEIIQEASSWLPEKKDKGSTTEKTRASKSGKKSEVKPEIKSAETEKRAPAKMQKLL